MVAESMTCPMFQPMEAIKCCATCGREIAWRKKWRDCWAEIRYCSEACRRGKPGVTDRAVEAAILALLGGRPRLASICPSEAARRHFGEDAWRTEMERCRQAARRLVAQGKIEITQKGRVVDPSTAKGPIRLRRGPQFP